MSVLHLFAERRNAVVAGLRQRIARLERLTPDTTAILPFELAALDAALPEAGLTAGLHEIGAAPGAAGALLGFAAALAGRAAHRGPVLWVGAAPPYGPGLAGFGLAPDRLLLARVVQAKTVPWVMEEGLKSRALAAVVGEVAAPLDLAAARRLQLAAAAAGGFALLLCAEPGSAAGAGVAVTRWRVDAAPSLPTASAQLLPALGAPRWAISLLHGRQGARPGHWIVEWEHGAKRFALAGAMAAALVDRPVAADAAAG